MAGNEVIATINKTVMIPLGLNRPKFQSVKESEEWSTEEQKHADCLKEMLEKGKVIEDSVEKAMILWSENHKKAQSLKLLKIEYQMIHSFVILKSLLDKSNYNPRKAISSLQKIYYLEINKAMLKRFPPIIDSIESLTKFQDSRHLTEAHKIRKYATYILEKMKKLYHVPIHKSLSEVIRSKKDHFYQNYTRLNNDLQKMTIDES